MRLYLALFLSIASISCYANIEEDKNAGTCAMYLMLAQKSNIPHGSYTPQEALSLAERQGRAAQYAKMYADNVKEYQRLKKDTYPLITEGVKSCYDIGFKLSR